MRLFKASLLPFVFATTTLFLSACGSSESPGSGQSAQQVTCTTLYVVENGGAAHDVRLYGQDDNGGTWAICKMNMILHG